MASEAADEVAGGAPRSAPVHHPVRRPVVAWLAPTALTLLAGLVRARRLDVPAEIYFDETYYVADAIALIATGVEEGFAVHPPLGKWLIGLGVAALGDGPVGWRAAVAAAGALTVLVTYLAALRLLRRRDLAALAGLLVAVDGLAVTMSRIAMLDGLVALGAITVFWLLLADRDAMWHAVDGTAGGGLDPSGVRPPRPPRGWRWLAALVLGATVAVKWSGVLVVAAAAVMIVAGELGWRRATTGRALEGWPRLLAHLAVLLVLIPGAVYAASYAGWFASYPETRPGQERCPDGEPCPVGLPQRLGDWAGEQVEIWRFHTELDASHPYRSHAAGWPVLRRPVAYAYEHCTGERRAELAAEGRACPVADDHVQHVLGLGNPAVWWLALPAYGVVAWFAVRRRDWRAWAIAAFYLAQYVPWLVQTRPAFLFYMTPIVPFIALSLAYACWRALAVRGLGRWLAVAVAVLALAALAYWHPVWTGEELTHEAWRQRMWLPGWI